MSWQPVNQNLKKTKFSSLRIVSFMFPLNPQFHDVDKLSPSRARHEFIWPVTTWLSFIVIADGINQSYIISKRLIWRWPNPNCSHRPLAVELLQVSSKLIWYTTHRSNAWSCPSKEVSIHKLVPSLSVVLPFVIAQFNMLIQQHTTQCSELFAWPQFSSKEKFDWACIKFEQAWSS